jgi:hypothetical protein
MPSIAQLLLEKAQQQGQMWQGIGKDIASIPGTIAQAQEQGRKAELQKIAVQNATQTQQGQQVIDQALTPVQPQGPQEPGAAPMTPSHPYLDDQGLVDPSKLTNVLNANGMGHLAPDLLKSVEAQNDAITKHQELQTKFANQQAITIGSVANTTLKLMDAGLPIDQAAQHASSSLLATGVIKPEQLQPVIAQLSQLPPDQQRAQLQQLKATAARLAPTKTLAKDASEVDMFGDPVASNIVSEPGKGDYTINGQRFKADGTPIGAVQPVQTPPKSYQKSSVLLDGKPSEILTDPTPGGKVYDLNGKPIDNAAARVKPIPPASMTVNPALVPSGDALNMAAQKYLATGELPSMGMGQAGAAARIAVMNAAAKIDPKASLAMNQATFKADQANLTNLQKTEGTLSSFEKTAGKNLDQFLSLADKIPDTGVPWLNQPIRTVNAKLLGDQDQAAFNAARDVALREIARVTNDPKLSGVLSDSARHEVSSLNPADATFAQIQSVAKVLKQDMANVHSSLNEQIANVKTGIGQTAQGDRVKVKGPNGESGTVPKGTALPSGWSLQ